MKSVGLGLAVLLLVPTGSPVERLELTISRSGFRPSRIEVRRGEAVRITVKSADEEHCFALDAFRVEKRVLPARAVVVDLVPDKAGSFPFHDCLASEGEARTGQLVVSE
jgi:heme/copper-type cytochrome/quinol oxidase subunit 2